MDAKPAKDTREPAYPTRREVLAGAASFVLVSLSGGSAALAVDKEAGVSVAPIFEHGTGRGATGCVVLVPPAFLSEEEGMQVIREVLAKHGVTLKSSAVLQGVVVPQRFLKGWAEGRFGQDDAKQVLESRKRAKPLGLDGIDPEKKVAVVFVSKQSYYERGGVQESYSSRALEDSDRDADDLAGLTQWYHSSTSQGYNFKEAAEFVAAQVKKQGEESVCLGLFYDPMWEPRPATDEKGNGVQELRRALEQTAESRKDDSKKLLGQQTQDFVGWLKKQKVIS
jgi:hypothetical protein